MGGREREREWFDYSRKGIIFISECCSLLGSDIFCQIPAIGRKQSVITSLFPREKTIEI
jgi:hypothetical protein